MTHKKEPGKKQAVELHVDRSLKNLWVDTLHLAGRKDNMCLIRLSTNLPEGLYEQVRFMTSKTLLKGFVDLICSTINYYPVKPQKKEQKEKTNPEENATGTLQ